MKNWILFILLFTAIILGIILPLLDGDSAYHALISLQISESGCFGTLADIDNLYSPYINGPHLQFWLAGSAFSWFGVGGVIYKLSSLFFVLIALLSTYKLGEYLSPRRGLGSTAALVLVSMFWFIFRSSVDIGMDAILTGAVALGVWQGIVAIGGGGVGSGDSFALRRGILERFRFAPVFGLAVGAALALSCNGMYGVLVIGAALLLYIAATRRWKWLFSWRFILVLLLFTALITPELWALYRQFGGQGVRFILFDQLLDKIISGDGISGGGSLFFAYSLLWATAPWCVLLLFFALRDLLCRRVDTTYRFTIISSLVVILGLCFWAGRFANHLSPLLPLLSIFIADRLVKIESNSKTIRFVAITQKIVVGAILALAIGVSYYLFLPGRLFTTILYGGLLVVGVGSLFFSWDSVKKIVWFSSAASAVFWIGINGNFYRQVAGFQSGNRIADFCNTRGIKPIDVLVDERSQSPSFDIAHGALHRVVDPSTLVDSASLLGGTSRYLLINKSRYNILIQDSLIIERGWSVLGRIPFLGIDHFAPEFLNPTTRHWVIDTVYLVDLISHK